MGGREVCVGSALCHQHPGGAAVCAALLRCSPSVIACCGCRQQRQDCGGCVRFLICSAVFAKLVQKVFSYRVSTALLDVHIGHVANTAMSVGAADGVPPLQPAPVGRLRR